MRQQTSLIRKNAFLGMAVLFCIIFFSSNLLAQLSGSYTIGPSGDYNSFSEAVTSLETNGISGNVVFHIATGTYDERFTITSIPGTSPSDTIRFVSTTGNAADVVISDSSVAAETNYIVMLDTAAYITFEKISFVSKGLDYCTIVELRNGTNHINFIDNIFTGKEATSISENTSLVHCNQRELDVNLNPDTLTFNGNTFNNGGTGIHLRAYELDGNRLKNVNIINNICSDQYYRGINLEQNTYITVKQNRVNSTRSGYEYTGIRIASAGEPCIASDNYVFASGEGNIYGMDVNNLDDKADNIVANNMVIAISSYQAIGMRTANCYRTYIYHNTVKTQGSGTNITFWEESHYSSDGLVHFANNIFYNEGDGVALWIDQDVDQNTDYLGTIDYNDYYTTGTYIAKWKTDLAQNISEWRTLSGQDANSISKSVSFISSTDLHLTGTSIGDEDLKGMPFSLVTDDYDGDTRNASNPYMGADEDTEHPLPVELASFTATIINSGILLHWTTASETNNYGFDVERKDSDSEWQKITFVQGQSTTTKPRTYTYLDKSIQNKIYSYRLKQIDFSGACQYSESIKIAITQQPETYKLEQNYPNPFNPSTTIQYSISEKNLISLKIYNSMGQLVRTLVNAEQKMGDHAVIWDGKDNSGKEVPSGSYFYHLKVGDRTVQTRQMIMIK